MVGRGGQRAASRDLDRPAAGSAPSEACARGTTSERQRRRVAGSTNFLARQGAGGPREGRGVQPLRRGSGLCSTRRRQRDWKSGTDHKDKGGEKESQPDDVLS